jgi:uncharacterized repeat protein (TIGR03803 family)
MLRKRFPCRLCESLTILMVAVTLIPSAWAKPKFKILHAVPGGLWTGVTLDAKGNLYGVTGAGGDHNQGIIFQLTPGAQGWTLTTLHNFDGQNGGTPNGGLIFDAAGNFYGTALGGKSQQGGGVAYEMVRKSSGWKFTVLYEFCLQYHCPDGGFPGSLTMDGMGNLYGNAGGGTYGEGIVFRLMPGVSASGWDEQVLYDFEGTKTGFGPSGTLILDAAGNLYGTTALGGKVSSLCYAGCGTVFELSQHSIGWKERKLWQFNETDGAGPRSGVVFDTSGNLYGTTAGGGGTCDGEPCGTVFELTHIPGGHWKEKVIYGFLDPANGFYPSGRVVFDRAGNLYGPAVQGGIGPCYNGCGVVYKLSPGADGKWKYTVLHKSISQAESPSGGGLVLDDRGNLYGTTYGFVYEITP